MLASQNRWTQGWKLGLIGAVIGLFAGVTVYIVSYGLSGREIKPYFVLWAFPLASGGFLFFWGAAFLEWVERTSGRIYLGGSGSTPPKREYSLPESLVVRGQFEAALRAYEECVAEDPTDAEPYLRSARIYRDRLNRPEDAIAAFRRAIELPGIAPGQEILAWRELIDVHLLRTSEPTRALPDLARLAAKFPQDPQGQWAKQRLRELKEQLLQVPEHG
ncbi:MAG: tetratricopeptide repeat protein [Gemmatimonadetes bacterium]|nr:tetratricopeptide repeat protein [Gemmatimonadota bacterium]